MKKPSRPAPSGSPGRRPRPCRFPLAYAEATATHPDVIAAVRDAYLKACEEHRFPPRAWSLVLTGPFGTGKTWQAYGAIRRIATAGIIRCNWQAASFPDLLAALRPRDGVDAEAEYDKYADADLLLVDDLGAHSHRLGGDDPGPAGEPPEHAPAADDLDDEPAEAAAKGRQEPASDAPVRAAWPGVLPAARLEVHGDQGRGPPQAARPGLTDPHVKLPTEEAPMTAAHTGMLPLEFDPPPAAATGPPVSRPAPTRLRPSQPSRTPPGGESSARCSFFQPVAGRRSCSPICCTAAPAGH